MKKIVFLIGLLFLISGCSSNKLVSNYDKMQVSDKGINGYTLDLRIYGNTGSKAINEVIRIEDNNNKEYKITRNITNSTSNKNMAIKEVTTYIIDGKTYVIDKNGKYVLTKDDVDYSNPSIYLEGLKNIAKINSTSKEKIGDNTYDVYNVIFNKSVIADIIKDTDFNDIKVSGNVSGKVYIDSKGYVYRIVYNIDKLTINANYFGVNKAKSINLSLEEDHNIK